MLSCQLFLSEAAYVRTRKQKRKRRVRRDKRPRGVPCGGGRWHAWVHIQTSGKRAANFRKLAKDLREADPTDPDVVAAEAMGRAAVESRKRKGPDTQPFGTRPSRKRQRLGDSQQSALATADSRALVRRIAVSTDDALRQGALVSNVAKHAKALVRMHKRSCEEQSRQTELALAAWAESEGTNATE